MSIKSNASLSPVLYLTHGGGPLPLLGDKGHEELIDNFKTIASLVGNPSAILVISAHWEEMKPTVTSGNQPSLIYDYYGFPKESYEIQYPAPGSPQLASKIANLLNDSGIAVTLDEARGFDHGLFVPLKIMFPEASIPCVQLSLVKSLDPREHINIGNALANLRKDKVLVIGSGSSFHNLKSFFSPASNQERTMNASFEQWLIDTCSNNQISEDERVDKLVDWEKAPAARFCHPREEHLLPLHVCYGIARSPAKQVFTFDLMGKLASCYLW